MQAKTQSIQAPRVPVSEKLRWTLTEACEMCGLSPNFVRELELKGEFPPRVVVSANGEDEGRKQQFIAQEVRAWSVGADWRAMVEARKGLKRHAS